MILDTRKQWPSLKVIAFKIFHANAGLPACRRDHKVRCVRHFAHRWHTTAVIDRNSASKVIGQALKKANGSKGLNARTATSVRDRRIGVGSDQGNRFDVVLTNWQHRALILEQHHAFSRRLNRTLTSPPV